MEVIESMLKNQNTLDLCRVRAEWYRKHLDELMNIIGEKKRLSPEEKRRAQEILALVKNRFKEDNAYYNSVSKHDTLSKEENDYYCSVFETSTRLRIRRNTDPIRSGWFGDLYNCHIDIGHYLSQIK